MKKYISCIVLVVLCLVCGMIFYANANELFKADTPYIDTGVDDSTPVMGGNGLTSDNVELPTKKSQGTILSEHLTFINLRIEWSLTQKASSNLILSCELYGETSEDKITLNGGFLSVNDEKMQFEKTTLEKESTLLLSATMELDSSLNFVTFSGSANISISDKNGVTLDKIEANGTVKIDDSFKKPQGSHLINLSHLSQYPSLPSGDEITCLAMVLNYLKYDADKDELCDLYLNKGPTGYTKPTEANVGNPESNFNSYGCLPPVIVNASNKFTEINNGSHTAHDISNTNLDVLYSYVSNDIPVIVWVCEDFEITPQISRVWIIDGEAYYAKSNSCTMVLIGYDFEKNTVTLSNPKGNVFTVDKDLFELRYMQMGSYGVVVTE